MVEAQAVIRNEAGIHCRPSAVIIKEASSYDGHIQVSAPSGKCDLTSTLELIMLGLEKGTKITIQVEGPDEKEFCRRLVELFETRFDFPPQ